MSLYLLVRMIRSIFLPCSAVQENIMVLCDGEINGHKSLMHST